MTLELLRADASRVDQVAGLFDAYRSFYGQPANLP